MQIVYISAASLRQPEQRWIHEPVLTQRREMKADKSPHGIQ